MARRKGTGRQGRSANIALDFGGMWASGDPRKMPEEKVRLLRNMYLRPGRVEKRDPWVRETAAITGTPSRFFVYRDQTNAVDVLCYSRSATGIAFRTSAGAAWTAVADGQAMKDYCNFQSGQAFGAYLIEGDGSGGRGSLQKFNGSAVSAVFTEVQSATCATFVNRIFLGNIRDSHLNKAAAIAANPVGNSVAVGFDDATYWTPTGCSVALSGGLSKVTLSGTASTDTLVSAAVYTTGASEVYVSYQQWLRPIEADAAIPLTIRITNGSTAYASRDIVLPKAAAEGDEQGWYVFVVTGRVPASTAVKIEINGNSATPNSKTFYASDDGSSTTNTAGAQVTERRLLPDFFNSTSDAAVAINKPNRFYWSETDDPTHFRATNYYDCTEQPGTITVIRAAKDRLWVFKDNATWGFRPTGKDSPAILQESFHRGFGCVGPQAYAQYRGDSIFIGKDEVYAWDHQSDPVELAGPGMREEMFDQSDFLGAASVCAVDYENKEIYCYTRPGKLYVYNLDAKGWSIFSFTGASDANLNIKDLIFVKPNGDSRAAVFAIMDATADIVKLNVSSTQENITGTNRDVVAKVHLRPIGSADPRERIQIQKISIDHNIQTTQTSTTATASVSFDGGNTFPRTNQITIDDLAAGDGDMKRLHVPLRQSGYYQMVELKHTGLAGPNLFNIYGLDVEVLLRGSEKDEETPTQVAATLT